MSTQSELETSTYMFLQPHFAYSFNVQGIYGHLAPGWLPAAVSRPRFESDFAVWVLTATSMTAPDASVSCKTQEESASEMTRHHEAILEYQSPRGRSTSLAPSECGLWAWY